MAPTPWKSYTSSSTGGFQRHDLRQRFEAGCINLHLGQAKANLEAYDYVSGALDSGAACGGIAARVADIASAPQSMSGAISGIGDSLREELRGFLGTFAARLEKREQALAEACDCVTMTNDQALSEISNRFEARLSEEARRSADEKTANMDVIHAGLRDLREGLSSQKARVDSIVAGEDWGRQLKEVTHAFDQKTAVRIDALERRIEEAKTLEAVRQKSLQETLGQRYDSLEQRVAKRHSASEAIVEQVTRLLPDIEQVRELCEGVKADRLSSESWQRRVSACENAASRIAALEAKVDNSERHCEKVLSESSHGVRECKNASGMLDSRISAVEGSIKGLEQQWRGAEQRLQASIERQQRQVQSTIDALREQLQQRVSELDTKQRNELERIEQHLHLQASELGIKQRQDLDRIDKRLTQVKSHACQLESRAAEAEALSKTIQSQTCQLQSRVAEAESRVVETESVCHMLKSTGSTTAKQPLEKEVVVKDAGSRHGIRGWSEAISPRSSPRGRHAKMPSPRLTARLHARALEVDASLAVTKTRAESTAGDFAAGHMNTGGSPGLQIPFLLSNGCLETPSQSSHAQAPTERANGGMTAQQVKARLFDEVRQLNDRREYEATEWGRAEKERLDAQKAKEAAKQKRLEEEEQAKALAEAKEIAKKNEEERLERESLHAEVAAIKAEEARQERLLLDFQKTASNLDDDDKDAIMRPLSARGRKRVPIPQSKSTDTEEETLRWRQADEAVASVRAEEARKARCAQDSPRRESAAQKAEEEERAREAEAKAAAERQAEVERQAAERASAARKAEEDRTPRKRVPLAQSRSTDTEEEALRWRQADEAVASVRAEEERKARFAQDSPRRESAGRKAEEEERAREAEAKAAAERQAELERQAAEKAAAARKAEEDRALQQAAEKAAAIARKEEEERLAQERAARDAALAQKKEEERLAQEAAAKAAAAARKADEEQQRQETAKREAALAKKAEEDREAERAAALARKQEEDNRSARPAYTISQPSDTRNGGKKSTTQSSRDSRLAGLLGIDSSQEDASGQTGEDESSDALEKMMSENFRVGTRGSPSGLASKPASASQGLSSKSIGEATPETPAKRLELQKPSLDASKSSIRTSGQRSREDRLSGLLGVDIASSGEVEGDASASLDDDDIEAIMARAVSQTRPSAAAPKVSPTALASSSKHGRSSKPKDAKAAQIEEMLGLDDDDDDDW